MMYKLFIVIGGSWVFLIVAILLKQPVLRCKEKWAKLWQDMDMTNEALFKVCGFFLKEYSL